MSERSYYPTCADCRRAAGEDASEATWQCHRHALDERDSLRTALTTAQAERDAAREEASILRGTPIAFLHNQLAQARQEAAVAQARADHAEFNMHERIRETEQDAKLRVREAQRDVEMLERKINEDLDAKIRLATVNEQLRAESRWNPLEDYHKRHVPGCRKHIYDPKSSPCSCQTEYDREFVRANTNERLANEQLARAQQYEAALARLQQEREGFTFDQAVCAVTLIREHLRAGATIRAKDTARVLMPMANGNIDGNMEIMYPSAPPTETQEPTR